MTVKPLTGRQEKIHQTKKIIIEKINNGLIMELNIC